MSARVHTTSGQGPFGSVGPDRGRLRAFTLIELPFDRLGSTELAEVRAVRKREGKAFTLIELLVVILIIMMLVGILLPTVARIRRNALASQSQAHLALIEGACRAYYSDFREYPPSGPSGPFASGAQRLVQCLTGYRNDDRCDGFGFRVVEPGDRHGPYNGAEGLPMKGSPPTFVDAFANPFLYYQFRVDPADGAWKYVNADNPADALNRTGPADANLYAQKSGGGYYRQDFIVISAGADGVFQSPASNPRSDDITNFFSK
jgi:type II secretory pathway pseudopilin PulG